MASPSDGTHATMLFVTTFSEAQRKMCRQIQSISRGSKRNRDLASVNTEKRRKLV